MRFRWSVALLVGVLLATATPMAPASAAQFEEQQSDWVDLGDEVSDPPPEVLPVDNRAILPLDPVPVDLDFLSDALDDFSFEPVSLEAEPEEEIEFVDNGSTLIAEGEEVVVEVPKVTDEAATEDTSPEDVAVVAAIVDSGQLDELADELGTAAVVSDDVELDQGAVLEDRFADDGVEAGEVIEKAPAEVATKAEVRLDIGASKTIEDVVTTAEEAQAAEDEEANVKPAERPATEDAGGEDDDGGVSLWRGPAQAQPCVVRLFSDLEGADLLAAFTENRSTIPTTPRQSQLVLSVPSGCPWWLGDLHDL